LEGRGKSRKNLVPKKPRSTTRTKYTAMGGGTRNHETQVLPKTANVNIVWRRSGGGDLGGRGSLHGAKEGLPAYQIEKKKNDKTLSSCRKALPTRSQKRAEVEKRGTRKPRVTGTRLLGRTGATTKREKKPMRVEGNPFSGEKGVHDNQKKSKRQLTRPDL